MEVALRGGLGQDATECVVGGVGFDGQGEIWLEVLEEGSRCESKLKLAERGTCLLCPGKLSCSLACQISKRGGEGRVTKNKLSIKIPHM